MSSGLGRIIQVGMEKSFISEEEARELQSQFVSMHSVLVCEHDMPDDSFSQIDAIISDFIMGMSK